MIDKIFDDIKRRELECSNRYMESLGLAEKNGEMIGSIPKKNMDLRTILSKLDLIKSSRENLEKINDFHDYLFKLGIELGVTYSKRMVIDHIQNHHLDFEQLLEINTDEYVNYELLPGAIYDMKEEFNEK